MLFNIIISDNCKDYDEMYDKIGDPIHTSMGGNEDYIESNVALHMIKTDSEPVCSLIVQLDKCEDKEFIRERLKNAIDSFIDNNLSRK